MATVPTTVPKSARAPWSFARRMTPAEGWSVLLLHIVVALAAAWTVALTPLAPPRADLAALTLGGLAVGFTLGKLRAPDLLAHAIAFAGGLLFSAWLVAIGSSTAPGGQFARARVLGELALEWRRRMLAGRELDDPALFAIILGLTVWLVAYTSAWTLYRRGWLATALLLPATIAFVNLGYAGQTDTTALLVLLAAACALAARYHGFRRQRAWARSGLNHPTALPHRFLWAGIAVALAVATVGWVLPLSARDGLGTVWQRLEDPWSAVQERWDDALARLAGDSDFGGGSYATFGDKFRLGGALDLSDEPVMIFRPTSGAAGPT
ncbi:MAG: hypothetical protein IT337_03475, partial [Thermomicrobiales bacterium]|nr:hypothetical protein [Thermomicrobiales bacterium]